MRSSVPFRPYGHAERSHWVLDSLARQSCPECGGDLQATGCDTLESSCPFCGWSSVYRRTSFLSRKLRAIVNGKHFDCPLPAADSDTDLYQGLPFDDYRYNHRYPLFVHRDARRIVLGDKGADFGPQARLTSGVPVVKDSPLGKNVVRCLDYLKVSEWVKWDTTYDQFLEFLETMKKRLQDTKNQTVIPVFKEHGFDWNLHRSGTSKYTYRLTSGDVTLLFNRRKHTDKIPNCRLEIGSLSCWSPGFYTIYERVKTFLAMHGGEIAKERVSEVHLAADFVGVDIREIDVSNQSKWIIKAHSFDPNDDFSLPDQDEEPNPNFGTHYLHRCFTGLHMGKGNLMLRIYDKVNELKSKRATNKQQVFSEIWGVNSYNELPVTRVEYQLRRPRLREFADETNNLKIDTVFDLLNSLKSLWFYLTTQWSRHALNPVDRNHNQTKSKISEFWEKVQAVVWSGVFGLVRTHPVKHRDIDLLRSMARGCLMSVCSSLEIEPDDIDKIVFLCKELIEEDLHKYFENEKEFRERMITRRNEFRATLAG